MDKLVISKTDCLLELKDICKSFGNVYALNNVTMSFQGGKICGLVGENGAGKTTLMRILAGEIQPDKGLIFINRNEVHFKNPRQSKHAGISLIHQEFSLIPYLSVAENLFLGKEPLNKFGLIDWKIVYKESKKLIHGLGIDFNVESPVIKLTTAEKQLLEIAKSLQEDPSILILDEPTAALEQKEVQVLFKIIENIKAQGKIVIFISHRLEEVIEISDIISVLRNGQLVLTKASAELAKDDLIKSIIGRKIESFFPPKSSSEKRKLIEIKGLHRDGKFKNINMNIFRGEILGLAGLEGQGQQDILYAIFGADVSFRGSGKILYKGRDLKLKHPEDAVLAGFGLVPGDRFEEGIIPNLPVKENILLPGLFRISRHGFINRRKEEKIVKETISNLSIKVANSSQLIKCLSGGNQQKVVLGKWLSMDTDVLFLIEPTQGVDIGTKEEIYKILRSIADKGKAIIFTTRDIEELIGLSDRIYIIYKGEITKELTSSSLTKEQVLDKITKKRN